MAEKIDIIVDHSCWILDEESKYKAFDCGKKELNDFLCKYTAVEFEKRNKTIMLAVDDKQVVAFIAYSIDKIGPSLVQDNDERLPFLIIEAFAVDKEFKGHGYGQMLMFEVIKYAFDISLKVSLKGIYLTAYQKAVPYYSNKFSFAVLNKYILMQSDPSLPVPMKLGIDAVHTIVMALNHRGKYNLIK